MPLTTLDGVNLLDNLTYSQQRTEKDTARIGLYTTSLMNGVKASMTSSMHTGLIEFQYPPSGSRYILADLSHYLPTQDDHMASQFYINARIELYDDGYRGFGIWRGGWNEGPDYTVYFCSKFNIKPKAAKLFRGPYTGMLEEERC
jgi:putative alpha-1,2-mannosidase